ncbi:MAG: hypothetical protein ABEJ70_06455 [Halobacteriaceae archaeon]
MWPAGGSREVSCIACGTRVEREHAREYDKHGNRWEREGKEFEYLCKPCFRDLAKCGRAGLEDLLVSIEAGRVSREEFLHRYVDAVETTRQDE